MKKVLVIDKDEVFASALRQALIDEGIEAGGQDFDVNFLDPEWPDVIVANVLIRGERGDLEKSYWLIQHFGLETSRYGNVTTKKVPIIFLTNLDVVDKSDPEVKEALDWGAIILTKSSITIPELVKEIKRLLNLD